MGFKLYFPSGPTKAQRAADDAEKIANALAEVKAGLKRKPVTDPKVWSGYPDGWSPGDEEDENDHVEVGLFQNLERCTRSNPTLANGNGDSDCLRTRQGFDSGQGRPGCGG